MPDAARFELTATQEWRRSWRRRLAPVAWVVLEELCEEADGDGEAHVSARSLAAVLDLDKDTVARALRVLTAAGVVAVGGQVREGGRFGRGSYRVVAGPVADRRADTDTGAKPRRSAAQKSAPGRSRSRGRAQDVGGQQSLFDDHLNSRPQQDPPEPAQPYTGVL
jgi:DNA-binding transcriptional ArsR family regulator